MSEIFKHARKYNHKHVTIQSHGDALKVVKLITTFSLITTACTFLLQLPTHLMLRLILNNILSEVKL